MSKENNTVKQLSYAYPTSTNAKQFGFCKTGCWVVSISPDWPREKFEAVAAFADYPSALAHAESLPYPWAVFCGQTLCQQENG